MESHLVQVACVHIRRVSAIQGAGLEGFHCTSYTYCTFVCTYVFILCVCMYGIEQKKVNVKSFYYVYLTP